MDGMTAPNLPDELHTAGRLIETFGFVPVNTNMCPYHVLRNPNKNSTSIRKDTSLTTLWKTFSDELAKTSCGLWTEIPYLAHKSTEPQMMLVPEDPWFRTSSALCYFFAAIKNMGKELSFDFARVPERMWSAFQDACKEASILARKVSGDASDKANWQFVLDTMKAVARPFKEHTVGGGGGGGGGSSGHGTDIAQALNAYFTVWRDESSMQVEKGFGIRDGNSICVVDEAYTFTDLRRMCLVAIQLGHEDHRSNLGTEIVNFIQRCVSSLVRHQLVEMAIFGNIVPSRTSAEALGDEIAQLETEESHPKRVRLSTTTTATPVVSTTRGPQSVIV